MQVSFLGGIILALLTSVGAAAVDSVNPPPGTLPDIAKLRLPKIERHDPVASKGLAFTLDGGRIGAARRNWPVRFAVPIPRGELKDCNAIALKTADGKAVPVQGRPTAFWPEGEVKWLLLDFLCDLPETGRAAYTLVYGTQVKPTRQSTLKVNETADAVRVETGAIGFVVAKGKTFLRDVTAAGKPVTPKGDGLTGFLDYSLSAVKAPEKMSIKDRAYIPLEKSEPSKEVLHAELNVETVKLVEKGIVQTTLQLDGTIVTKTVAYPVRIYVTTYAGSPLVLVRHSLIYTGYPERDCLRSYGLDLSVVGSVEGRFGVDNGKPLSGRKLIQKDDESLVFTAAAGEQTVKARSGGWLDAGVVAAAVQDLWRNYPVTLAVQSAAGTSKLRTALYGPEDGGFLDLRYRVKELKTDYDGGGFCSARGIQKTHTILYRFGEMADAPSAEVLGPGLDQPPVIVVEPAYVAKTGVLGLISTYEDDKALLPLKNAASLVFDWAIYAAHNNRWYGFTDNADLNASPMKPQGHRLPFRWAGGIGWSSGNNIVSAFFIHFLLTGERKYFDFGSRYAQHKVDIDFEHVGGEGEEIALGEFSRHNQIHWRSGGGPRQAPIQGLIRKYWLTGDPVTMDAVKLAVEWLVRPAWGSAGILDTTHVTFHSKSGSRLWPAYLYGQTVGDDRYAWFIKPWARALEGALDLGKGIRYQDGIIPVDKNGQPDLSDFRGTGVPGGYFFTYDAVSPLVDYAYLTADPDAVRALLKLAYVLRQNPNWLNPGQDYFTYDRFLSYVYEATGDPVFYNTIYRCRLSGHAGWINCKGTPQETYTTQSLLKNLGRLFVTGTNNLGLRLTALKVMPLSARAFVLARECPVAAAGPDQVLTASGDGKAKVRLSAAESTAPAGKLVAFEWASSRDDRRQVLSTEKTVEVPLSVGRHAVILRVTDDAGRVSHDRTWITVLEPGTVRVNFQPADAVGVAGYAPAIREYDEQAGFGWDGQPAVFTERYSPPRYGARLEGDGVVVQNAETRLFRVRVPNGTYRAALGVGNVWDDKASRHRVRLEGPQVDLHMMLAGRVTANFVNIPVKVTDGELTLEAGGSEGGATSVCYLQAEPESSHAEPLSVAEAIDSEVGPGARTPQARLSLGAATPPEPYVRADNVWGKPVDTLKMPIVASGQIPVLETDLAGIPAGQKRTFSLQLGTYLAKHGMKQVYLDLGVCAPSGADGPVSIEVDNTGAFRVEQLPEGTVLRLRNIVASVKDGRVSFAIANGGKKPVGVGFVRMDSYNRYLFVRKFPW